MFEKHINGLKNCLSVRPKPYIAYALHTIVIARLYRLPLRKSNIHQEQFAINNKILILIATNICIPYKSMNPTITNKISEIRY